MNDQQTISLPLDPLFFFKLFLLILLYSGCTHDIPTPALNSFPADSCTQNVNYENDIRLIVTENCALEGCHVPTGFKDFTSYAALVSVIETSGKEYFLTRISEGGGMPPDYTSGPDQLTPCDLAKFRSWLQSGYPEQ